MALDTQNKRRAVMHWGPGLGSLPVPDGALNAGDREQLMGLTRFSDVTPPVTTGDRDDTRWGWGFGFGF